MSKTFFIADTHFGDKDILMYENRPFASVEEMNTTIISNWNSVVDDDDTVFVVGDFFSGENPNFQIISKLKGHIKLIVGNHDTPYLDIYEQFGNLEIIPYEIILDEFWMVSHKPKYVCLNMPYANIFAHVHANPMYSSVSPRSFCVSVERINYTPIEFGEIKEKVKECSNGKID